MNIRMRPAIVIRLVILSILAVALMVMAHAPSRDRMFDALAYENSAHVDTPLGRVSDTAVHEAGHAVVCVALRGIHSVESVRVYTNEMRDENRVLYGRSATDTSVRPHSRHDALCVAAVFYAGHFAEDVILDKDAHADSHDNQMASVVIVGYRSGTFPVDGFAATKEAVKSEEATKAMLTDMDEASTCADAAVQANAIIIRTLADEILRQPIHFGRHYMTADDLNAFFVAHPVMKPSPECDFDQ